MYKHDHFSEYKFIYVGKKMLRAKSHQPIILIIERLIGYIQYHCQVSHE